jgi:D-amino-acid dehydrogenase
MREACVVGAGVVGVTTAWYLAEAGWRVRLLERSGAPGTGTSFRNGGQLSYRYVSPLADAGVPLKALQWLLQRDAPLRFKPTLDWAQWRWLAQFVARCHGAANRETTARLAQLGAYSRDCMGALLAEHALPDFGWQESGKLVVYRTPATFHRAARQVTETDLRRVWSAAECLQAQPALADMAAHLQGGIFTRDEAVADCHGFCVALLQRLQAHPNFRGLLAAEATAFTHDPQGRPAVQTSDGPVSADALVLAAGIASRRLAAPLGLDLPLYPLKGYSLGAPIDDARHRAPGCSITDFERKVLYARIGDELRIAAMVDLVGEDERIDPRRIASLLRIVRRDMPHAGDYDRARPWAGLRPATPGGAPILGESPVPGLWLNVGHGGLGFTFACGSASILARLMSGLKSPLPLEGLTWPTTR